MRIRGIVQSAEFVENPPDSGRIEMTLRVQGVGPDQPRRLVVPFALLLEDQALEPDSVRGRSFTAEAEQEESRRWVVSRLHVAGRDVLGRSGDDE